MEEDTVSKSSNVILAIMYVAIFLAIMLLAVFIVLNSMSIASTNINGVTLNSTYVANETGYANSSGYTLTGASNIAGFLTPTVLQVYNRTSGNLIGSNNITVSTLGVVTNRTAVVWNNLSISYSYQFDTTAQNPLNTVYNSVLTNILGLVGNFFSLAPTIGTIFAVIILIAGIVILVLYVRRMKGSGSEGGYTG